MTRDQACDAFEVYFAQKVSTGDWRIMQALNYLKHQLEETGLVQLRCFCHPQRCHTQTIRRWLIDNAFDNDDLFI